MSKLTRAKLEGVPFQRVYTVIQQLAADRYIAAEDYYLAYTRQVKAENQKRKQQAIEDTYGGYYNYRFLDKHGNIIYIGYTHHLYNRLEKQHFTKGGHLPKECYALVDKIEITKFRNENEAKQAEAYYINQYRTKYNKKDVNQGDLCWTIPYLDNKEWTIYTGKLNYKEMKIKSRKVIMDKWFKEHKCEVNYMDIYKQSVEASWPLYGDEDEEDLRDREEHIQWLITQAKNGRVIW